MDSDRDVLLLCIINVTISNNSSVSLLLSILHARL